MRNYYEELEVSRNASKEVIEKVYKILAKKYHPDTTEESDKKVAEEKFKIISEAYETLSNDEKRKIYDFELEQSNPTISYADYMYILNERDELKNIITELKAKIYHYSPYFQNFNTPSNNPSNNINKTNYYTNNNFYKDPPNEPYSNFYNYKNKTKKFFSTLGFYILLIIIFIIILKNIISKFLNLFYFFY